jgi:hypothetical protein
VKQETESVHAERGLMGTHNPRRLLYMNSAREWMNHLRSENICCARRNFLRRFPFGLRAVDFRYPDRFRQTEELQDFDLNPGQIELIPD